MSPPARRNLLPVAAFVSLLVLALGATGLFALHLTNAKAASGAARVEAIERTRQGALQARGAFKTQVQEWKNILLRGHAPGDFSTYRERFEQEEARVRAELEALRAQPPSLDLPAAVPGLPDVSVLIEEHTRLGAAYRAALADFAPGDPASPRRVDAAVRGADRKLSDELDAFAAEVEKSALAATRALRADADARYEGLRRVTWIVAAFALFASLWLAFLANRAARG